MELTIQFGSMAEPLIDQIYAACGVEKGEFDSDSIQFFSDLSDAATKMYIIGLLTEKEVGRVRKRIMKELSKAFKG